MFFKIALLQFSVILVVMETQLVLWYLDGFPSEHGSGGTTLEAPGLVELDQTFVVLQSYSSRDSRTAWTSVHLWGGEELETREVTPVARSFSLSLSVSPPTWASANTQMLAVASGENWSWPSVRMVP